MKTNNNLNNNNELKNQVSTNRRLELLLIEMFINMR